MSRLHVLGGLALTLIGCEGSLLGPRVERPVDPNLPEDAPRELPAPSSRAPRLSHVEYENAVRDLLGAAQTLGVTANFTADNTSSTFDNNGGDLNVTSTQWTDYQTAAEDLARRATLDLPTLTTVAGGTLPTDDRALIAALGRRIYRRDLTTAELDAQLTLFGEGLTYYPTLAPRLAGARLVLEALFQSPHFLYRLELSTVATGEVIPLSGGELAARLSFGLWQSTPDEALLTAAADGSLLTIDGYTAQVNRMLLDSRARQATQAFHAQLLQQSKFADITRSTNLFPEFTLPRRRALYAAGRPRRALHHAFHVRRPEPRARVRAERHLRGELRQGAALRWPPRRPLHADWLPRVARHFDRERPDSPRRVRQSPHAVRAAARASERGAAVAAPRPVGAQDVAHAHHRVHRHRHVRRGLPQHVHQPHRLRVRALRRARPLA
jgi:hypothetical protein